MIAAYVLGVVAAVAVFEAFRKQRNVAGIKASVLREVAFLELIAQKVDATAVADYKGAIARIKGVF